MLGPRKEILKAIFKASLLLFVLSRYTAESVRNSKHETAKIVGGVPTTIARFPYLVNIRLNGRFICGGSLITRQHVVTAAHCIFQQPQSALTVVGGETLLTDQGVRRNVTKVIRANGFSMQTFNTDIAVLRLSAPMVGTNIRPIGLCRDSWRPGTLVQIAGWGVLNETDTRVPNRLHTTKVRLVGKAICRRQYQGVISLTPSMFCASVNGLRDSCSGDSGGPLIYKGRLCGVVSFGKGCAQRNFPGIYTSIKKLRNFIRNALRNS